MGNRGGLAQRDGRAVSRGGGPLRTSHSGMHGCTAWRCPWLHGCSSRVPNNTDPPHRMYLTLGSSDHLVAPPIPTGLTLLKDNHLIRGPRLLLFSCHLLFTNVPANVTQWNFHLSLSQGPGGHCPRRAAPLARLLKARAPAGGPGPRCSLLLAGPQALAHLSRPSLEPPHT